MHYCIRNAIFEFFSPFFALFHCFHPNFRKIILVRQAIEIVSRTLKSLMLLSSIIIMSSLVQLNLSSKRTVLTIIYPAKIFFFSLFFSN